MTLCRTSHGRVIKVGLSGAVISDIAVALQTDLFDIGGKSMSQSVVVKACGCSPIVFDWVKSGW